MSGQNVWTGIAIVAVVIIGFGVVQRTTPPDRTPGLIEGLRTEISSLSDSMGDLAARLDETDGAIAALSSDLDGLSQGIETLRADVSASAEAQADLDQRLAAAADTASRADAGLQELSGAQDGLRDSLAGLSDKLGALAAAPAAAAATAAPAPADTPQATETAAAGDGTDGTDATDDRLADLAAAGGIALGVGETARAGDVSIFLSRLTADAAYLRIPGQGPVMLEANAPPTSIGGGCELSLLGTADRRAMLLPECGPGGVEVAASSGDLPGAADFQLRVGQTARFGEARVFLSRLSEGGASVRLYDGNSTVRADLSPRQPHMLRNGCGLALMGMSDGAADLRGACGADLAGLAVIAAAAPAPDTTPAQAVTPQAASAETAAAGGAATFTVGQTITVGDQRIFLSRLADDAASLMLVGVGPATLDRWSSLALGNGCELTLTAIEGRTASLESRCD